jgi:signal transduction histidine kinase
MNLVQLCNPAYEYKVEVALFKLAQRNAILEVLAPIVMPLVIYLTFGRTLDMHGFTLWLSCLLLPITTGLLTYRVLHPQDKLAMPSVEHLRTWRKTHALYSIAAGIGWGAMGFLFDAIHANQNTAMFVTYLAVVTIGGNASGVHSFRAYFIAVAISMVLIMATLPNAYGAEALPMSIIMAVYPFFLARISLNSQATIMRMIELQIENEQLLKDKAIAMQLAERERIYRDLHDDVGAKLLGLAISAQRSNQPREADLARSALQDLRDVVSRSAHNVSRMDELLADWRAETAQRVQSAGLALDWRIPVDDQPLPVSAAAALNMSRILRETVTNVLRHANATRITVDLAWREEKLRLTIQDDGVGLPEAGMKGNRGMSSMRARAAALGGSIEWESLPAGGCMVVVEVSLPHLAQDAAASQAA